MSFTLLRKFCSAVFRTLLVLFLLNSCQKTVADFDNENPPEPPVSIGDSTCLFTTINFNDDIDRKYSKHFEMDVEGKPVRCYEIDDQGVLLDWEMKFSPGRIDLLHGQWIKLDGNGRVAESNTGIGMHVSGDIIFRKKYFYNTEGYLVRIEQVSNLQPEQYNAVYSYTWTDGNLTTLSLEQTSGFSNRIEYRYDTSVKVSNFMEERNLDLLMYFQHFLNLGKKSKNLLKTSERLFYDESGLESSRETFDYFDHKIDANGNVLGFQKTQTLYSSGSDITDQLTTRHTLTYDCK
ncbi:MAG: hypothetical protein ABW036_06585 [Flavitalea sp.]